MQKERTFSLRENVRLRLLMDMLRGLKTKFENVPNFLMVCDSMTTRIVSSCTKMIELLEEGVVAIEKLELQRKPFPKMHVIYFITPTKESIDRLCQDFDKPKEPQYGNVHLFFTNKVENPYMDLMSKKKALIERVVTFKEANLDFLCPQDTVFSLDMPESLPVLFSKKDSSEYNQMVERIGYKLATVIPTLFDFEKFHIIYNKNSKNDVSEKVAKIVKERVKRFLQLKKNDDEDEPPAPCKIIIMDRAIDPLTPFLHDFHYWPMVYDLLEVKGNDIVEYPSEDSTGKVTTKQAQLGETDDLWNKYKCKHISQTMKDISDEFNKFVANNKTAQMQRNQGDVSLKEMGEIVKKMPQYKELMSKYTLHMSLIEQCIKYFKTKDLKGLQDIEQSLVTGLDSHGSEVKRLKLIQLIASHDAQGKLNDKERLRLMMLATLCFDMSEKDKKSFYQQLSEDDVKHVNKINWMVESAPKGIDIQGQQASAKQKAKSSKDYDLVRYTPALEKLAKDLTADKLDKSEYGSMFIPDNYDGSVGQRSKITAGSAAMKMGGRANWNENMDEKNQPKYIFFIIGGISHTELRLLQEFENNNAYVNVLSGSTHLMNPYEYIDEIKKMQGR
mmetsp:Transcript_14020/g.11997  ORF Transcript_14020/g.11997 Transcript_14020/m.11997 type:complete len:614 (+) Transcript_14020:59-1900(+)